MTTAYAHVKEALTGVVHLLLGRDDFHGRFDVSLRGVAASFGAAIIAIPFWAFVALVFNELARLTSGQIDGGSQPMTLTFVVARWVATWAYFPLIAAAITAILGRRQYFGPWIVVHNWTHLFVLMIQAVPLALVMAGAPQIGGMLYNASILIWAYAYVAAAKAALDVGWGMAIPCGSANLACALLVDAALERLLLPAAPVD